MSHQDWTPIIFNNSDVKKKEKTQNFNKQTEDMKIETPKNLGQLISQARTTKSKNQKQLSIDLGISISVLSRWETNKEVPNNSEIAKIERILGIKLPRSKKVKNLEN